jgi:hypothetical protein
MTGSQPGRNGVVASAPQNHHWPGMTGINIGTTRSFLKKALNKSIRDLTEHEKSKCDFDFSYIFQSLE